MRKSKSSKTTTDSIQAIIDIYKKDVDRTLIRQNLKLTVEQRILKLQNFQHFALEMQKAGKKVRKSRGGGKPL